MRGKSTEEGQPVVGEEGWQISGHLRNQISSQDLFERNLTAFLKLEEFGFKLNIIQYWLFSLNVSSRKFQVCTEEVIYL